MSNSAVQVPAVTPRRHLSDRQARTVQVLTEAAVEELTAEGYSGLTVRNVAKRAGVAPATAYTYFASKEHLVAEVFWRRFQQQEQTVDRRRSPTNRATDVLVDFVLAVPHETELSAACTVALLADNAEVRELRIRIGAEMHRRLVVALGSDATEVEIRTLELATSGALLQVGTGHIRPDAIAQLLAETAATVLGATP